MTSRIPFYFLITLLVIAGAALSMYRHDVYGVPWTPGEERALWELEARIEFDAIGDPVKVSMAAPETQQALPSSMKARHLRATVSHLLTLTWAAGGMVDP